MYQQFLDQAGTLFKPLQELMTLNQSAFETLASKQSALVSEILNDSISFAQQVMSDKEGNYWDLHKSYWEGLGQKLNQATHDTADYLTATQAKMSDMLQESALGNALAEVTKNMPSVEAAMASALKPMETAKIKPAPEVAAKVPAAKPPQVQALASKPAEIKPAAAKPPVAKPVAAKPVAAKPANPKAVAAKPAAKPVTSKPAAPKAVVKTVAPTAEVKAPVKAAPAKPAASSEKTTGKKVSGDDASVESVIRSIMSERNH
jgi:Phasin protein